MSELPEVRALLERARDVGELPPERRMRVRAALIGSLVVAPTSVAAAGGAVGGLAKLSWATKVVLGVALVGGAGASVWVASDRHSSGHAATVTNATAAPSALVGGPSHDAPASSGLPEPEVAVDVPTPSPAHDGQPHSRRAISRSRAKHKDTANVSAPQAPADAPAAAPTLATPPPGNDALQEELRLVQEANLAMREGRPSQALTLLEQHRRQFPSGALLEERQAARIAALCALGRTEEAREEAARFLRGSPRSLQAARVRASCAGPSQ